MDISRVDVKNPERPGSMQPGEKPYAGRLAGCERALRRFGRLVMAITAAATLDVAYAQLARDATTPPPPPDEVSGADLMNSMRSEVKIIARENHEIEEYRVGNNVYMVKVKPRNAPPYYLIDQDGSGNLQWSRGPDLERIAVPHWAILSW